MRFGRRSPSLLLPLYSAARGSPSTAAGERYISLLSVCPSEPQQTRISKVPRCRSVSVAVLTYVIPAPANRHLGRVQDRIICDAAVQLAAQLPQLRARSVAAETRRNEN